MYFKPGLRVLSVYLFTAILIFSLSCEAPENIGRGDSRLVGTWRLVKRFVESDTSSSVRLINQSTPHTLSFDQQGSLSSTGKETEYYRSSKYYIVDSTATQGLRIGFLVGTGYSPFYQQFKFNKDTLILIPPCKNFCGLYFIK